MTEQNTRLGIILMIATTVVFALQDGLSRHLAGTYNVYMVVMIRYWFFAAFVIAMTVRRPGGLARAVATRQPLIQTFRGLLLAFEVVIMVLAFTKLGLVESHSIFTSYPLLVAALSGPVLGEKVGWRRWAAIGVGFVGVLIILEPGVTVFSPWAILPLICAFMFALYGLLTRFVARKDPAAVSFFWTGISGAVAMTALGAWFWQPMSPSDWVLMAVLCCTAVLGHWLLIRAFEVAEASAIQPFAFLQLIFASALGITVFGDALHLNTVIGAAVVVSAGLFTLWRARVKAASIAPSAQP
ncbi:MAG: EamA family transporter [Rhodobacteraceae bacterium]|nr:EamA family transporter [Paracoccaceae bacterium]